jgi:hypothetical protein
MEDGGEDTGDEASIQIRIGIATYDPGMTNVVGVTPNSKGYRDLLNIITRIRIELAQKSTIKELTVVEKPIKWGLYEEQSYPYWHGWISFSATTMPLKYSNQGIEKYL